MYFFFFALFDCGIFKPVRAQSQSRDATAAVAWNSFDPSALDVHSFFVLFFYTSVWIYYPEIIRRWGYKGLIKYRCGLTRVTDHGRFIVSSTEVQEISRIDDNVLA